jgi:glutamine synthetase
METVMNREGFVAKHGLWSEPQWQAADGLHETLRQKQIETVRVSFADQHGSLRAKTFTRHAFDTVLTNGCRATSTLLLKDTSHRTAFPIWGEAKNVSGFSGASDFVLVPDPTTFRVLPWANRTGFVLCDAFSLDGRPIPFSTRQILRAALASLASDGYSFVCGIELELSLYRRSDNQRTHAECGQPGAPPAVSALTPGFQLLSESRYDEIEPVLDSIREALVALELPVRSLEIEMGPGQVELTFDPAVGLEAADQAMLIRSAVRQVCRRQGYFATFMARPAFPNAFASGWHLHQSLVHAQTGKNVFASSDGAELLSPIGKAFAAGLLNHAREACLFAVPTINGYKRFRPNTMAPDRIVWGRDNRGAMLRVVGAPGDPGTHLENRAGEPLANPYLYLASQIVCGNEGIRLDAELPEEARDPYAAGLPRLPRNLFEAIHALRGSRLFRSAWGDAFVDYFTAVKEFELNRFLGEDVTDWEQREYFENF